MDICNHTATSKWHGNAVLRSERKRAIELAARSDVWFMGRCTQKVRYRGHSNTQYMRSRARAAAPKGRTCRRTTCVRATHAVPRELPTTAPAAPERCGHDVVFDVWFMARRDRSARRAGAALRAGRPP